MRRNLVAPLVSSLAALALVAIVPNAAPAQTFNFNTTGYFTSASAGCDQADPGAITVTCDDPGSDLFLDFIGKNFTATEPFGFMSGSVVDLGEFSAYGSGALEWSGADVLFTLVINQTMPNTGEGQTVGAITGELSRPVAGASFSDLVWRPTEIVVIEPVTYDLVFREDVNGIVIAASGATSIEAVGTVAPEPATMALLGTGLLGLAGVARRRRRKNSLEV